MSYQNQFIPLLVLIAGRWPWKSKPAKECVTTHLPNQLALKMDGAEASHLVARHSVGKQACMPWVVEGLGGPHIDFVAVQSMAQAWTERPPVRILVVVANIQGRILQTEVGKGSV